MDETEYNNIKEQSQERLDSFKTKLEHLKSQLLKDRLEEETDVVDHFNEIKLDSVFEYRYNIDFLFIKFY